MDTRQCKVLAMMALLAGPLAAQELRSEPRLKLWSVSVAQMMAGTSFDACSSIRMNQLADRGLALETNGAFADGRGRYVAARALPIQFGTYAGIAAGEYLLLRRHPKMARAFSVVNFGLSGIGFGMGFHNMVLYNQLSRR